MTLKGEMEMTKYQVECLIDYDMHAEDDPGSPIWESMDTLMDELQDFSAVIGTAGKGDSRLHILMTVGGNGGLLDVADFARSQLFWALIKADLQPSLVLTFEVVEEGEWDKREGGDR